MSSTKVIYIDDRPDPYISQYLIEKYEELYEELNFDSEMTYENLLITLSKFCPCILLIDSKLFENNNAGCKFTGEEFMMILRNKYPYCEIFIITQNDDYCENIGAILKYRYNDDETYFNYYNKILLPLLKQAEVKIEVYRSLIEKMSSNKTFDDFVIEKIKDSINGINNYSDLKTDDIDRLVEAFRELKEKI